MSIVLHKYAYTGSLILFSIIGMLLVFINTSTYGPGITSDGMQYLAAADSLVAGRGFLDPQGEVYILWPPLYPSILAGLHWISGLDVIVAGWILNSAAFGVILLLTGNLIRKCLPERPLWPIIGVYLTVLSVSNLSLASNIASDTLFIAIMLAFLIACERYLTRSSRGALGVMFILATLAPLQRFLGGCVVVVGALVILVKHWKGRPLKALGSAFLFGLGASIPSLVWVIGRNYLRYGSLTGPRQFRDYYLLPNILDATRKILHWFIPYAVLDVLPLGLILGLLLSVFLILSRRRHWSSLLERLFRPSYWPVVAFTLLYLFMVVPTTIAIDHTSLFDDRLQVVVFIPVLIGIFTALKELVFKPLGERGFRLVVPITAAAFLIWSIYPLYGLWKYVNTSIRNGEAVYDEYNGRRVHESPIMGYLEAHPFGQGIAVYSNDPEVVYLYERRFVEHSPRARGNRPRDELYLREHYSGWPLEGEAYLVWFLTPGDRRYYYSPEELEKIAIVEPEYVPTGTGGIYKVRPR